MALNEAGNPYRCNCCWTCGDCMPFVYISPTCPAMNFGSFLCRSAPKPDWVVPSYTPKCKAPWDATGVDCVYGSGPIANDDCSCIGYFGAYCIDDANGTNGRSWVVEFWCTDGLGGPANVFNTIVQDWTCACDGAYFEYSLTIGGCCCECGPLDCADCTDLPQYLTFEGTSNCFGDVTVTLDNGGSGRLWTGSGTSSFSDTIAVTLDMDNCEFKISCNGELDSVVDLTGMIAGCDPLQIDITPTVTFIAGCCTGPIPSPVWSGTITE